MTLAKEHIRKWIRDNGLEEYIIFLSSAYTAIYIERKPPSILCERHECFLCNRDQCESPNLIDVTDFGGNIWKLTGKPKCFHLNDSGIKQMILEAYEIHLEKNEIRTLRSRVLLEVIRNASE